ncbi:MAG: DUF294 nucleotidyltransferase-like domain-containing protein [Verrucomicrobia bacterium]|nr:DUF294 nucleotidyltransferase-like domain-containing protein [Verrucomicrobiota bacterium]
MKAEAIALRIADFLKQHPPFQFLSQQELVELAAAGRVKFHENGEIVFTAGQPRTQYIYVIRQGKVRVVDELPTGEHLIDIRGEGDLLGLHGLLSEDPYLHTVKTEADTLLYALPKEALMRLTKASPTATRYLAAYFTLNPAYQEDSSTHHDASGVPTAITLRKGGLIEVEEPHRIARSALVTVRCGTAARSIAAMLSRKSTDCVIVVDEQGLPIGKVTDADFRDRVLQGPIDPAQPVESIMFRDIVTAHSSDTIGKLLIRLTRSGKRFLVVTEDGTPNTRALGLISERNIFLRYGRFPTVLGEAIASAPDVTSLRNLRDRVEALILEFLEDRTSLDWLMQMVGVLNRKMVQRILQLSATAMIADGWAPPTVDFCWLMMGSGGRDELLIRSAVYHAMIYEDPESAHSNLNKEYFKELAHRTSLGLRQCGFMDSPQEIMADKPGWCLPLSEMKQRYTAMIAEPVLNNVYNARDAFDFVPVQHNCYLAKALRDHISDTIEQHPDFIRHMARDSLLNQPPRTLFQEYVVDKEGVQREELEIKYHAILPLVDVGRVLSLDAGWSRRPATYRRLERAARLLRNSSPVQARLLQESANAFRVVVYARTFRGLISGTDGAVIKPADLDAEIRMLLKTAFRTILDLLEFTAQRYQLSLRN